MKEAGFPSDEERIYFDLRKSQMLDILELTRQNGALGEWPWIPAIDEMILFSFERIV